MVPDGWVLTTLGDLCGGELRTGPFGSQLHASEYVKNGVPVLMPKDLIDCRAAVANAARITPERAKALAKHKLEIGDLLFSRRGDVSRFALIDDESEGALCGTGCLKARPSGSQDSLFISYFLQLSSTKRWLEQSAVGQTMPNLNTAILTELPLMAPKNGIEQRKIAKILSAWDQAIATKEQLLANSEKQKKALMQQSLTGKKRLPGFEGAWQEVTLGELLEERNERGIEGLPLLSVTADQGVIYRDDVGRKDTSSDDKSKYLKVCKGDIAYNTMRMWQGVSALSGLEGIVSPAYTVLKPTKSVDSRFASYLFKLPAMIHKFYRHSQGLVSDTWNLKYKNFSKIKALVPDVDEQKSIAEAILCQDKAIEVIVEQLEKLKGEKKALMQQLLTGKRRVKTEEAA